MLRISSTILILIAALFAGCNRGGQAKVVNVASGRVVRIESFRSEYIRPRNVDIWLPSDYSPDRSYPVLYMHDGQMLFDSTTTWNHQEWGVDETVARLAGEERIRDVIVAGIWNTPDRYEEYYPQVPFDMIPEWYYDTLKAEAARQGVDAPAISSVRSDDYLAFIVNELKPFIDSTWSTDPSASSTFVAGSSMGGLISIYAICRYPEVFGGAACLSTHWPGGYSFEGNPVPITFRDFLRDNLPDPSNHRIYFDHGTETLDSLYAPWQLMIDTVMVEGGYNESNWMTRVFDGANHSENAWRERLEIPLLFLLTPEADH